MTIAFATRYFISGTVVQAPFVHALDNDKLGGSVELVGGEVLARDTWVAPVLRRLSPLAVEGVSFACASAAGRMNSAFECLLTRNSLLHEMGERGMHLFNKIKLSTLIGWLTIEPFDSSTDLPRYALELFPRESALIPLQKI